MTVLRQISDESMETLQRTNREVSRRQRGNVRPSQGRWHKKNSNRTRTAVLDDQLSAATNALTTPGTANASLLVRNSSGNLEDSGETIQVINRFEHITVSTGTLILVQRVDGEWRAVGADCDPLGSWP